MGRALLHVAYHGGRCVSYVVVGLLCGTVGAVLDLGGSLIGVYRAAAILAGVLMIGTGIITVLRYSRRTLAGRAGGSPGGSVRLPGGASELRWRSTVAPAQRRSDAHVLCCLAAGLLPVRRRGSGDRHAGFWGRR